MAKQRSTSKKNDPQPIYVPPPERWYFYIGEKYYRRLQVVPYQKSKIPEYIKKLCDKK